MFIADNVVNKADWKVNSLRQITDYSASIKRDLKVVEQVLEATMRRRGEQHAELLRIARQRYPQGIPRDGALLPQTAS